MSVGFSLFTIAVGANSKFAVTAQVAGISVSTVGLILMVAGAIGLVGQLAADRDSAVILRTGPPAAQLSARALKLGASIHRHLLDPIAGGARVDHLSRRSSGSPPRWDREQHAEKRLPQARS